MAFPNRLNSGPRHTSFGGQPASSAQSPMLLARINEKKAELDNLKQLRDLSAGLATQMQTLQEKLSTLSNGTEAVAAVLSNWHTVLQAINMASMKIPKPKVTEGGEATEIIAENTLPQTLVRIPVEREPSPSPPQDGSDQEP
ncbi:MAG: hypothetical protein L6R38_005459 [Xanthoria sp. 2 TBL-2021]|nr:MAG: hypothetical protein L6R38_005459 [Xanthoria sp. 2 TBL-2021]